MQRNVNGIACHMQDRDHMFLPGVNGASVRFSFSIHFCCIGVAEDI